MNLRVIQNTMNKSKVQSPKSKVKSLFAKKSFGQNFLVDRNYIDKIISALNPQAEETIVEIGAGRGALTEKLVESGANIVAIELERNMVSVLKAKFAANKNFTLIEQDALQIDFKQRTKDKGQRTKLVANLPFNISTAILQKLIEQREVFSEMILMFQREVVERITAQAGTAERGFLTVLVEAYLEAEKLFDIPPNAFLPAPKVWSAVVKLTPKSNINIKDERLFIKDERLFKLLLSAAFRQKRKTIWNNLKNFETDDQSGKKNWEEIFSKTDISARSRAESLTITEWKKLFDSIYEIK